MAETILCNNEEICNCVCNCQAYLSQNESITVDELYVVENEYTFKYTISNILDLSYVIFCVECQTSRINISNDNTSVVITGNPDTSPVTLTRCMVAGCESAGPNRYYVGFNISNEPCCRYQGIKIDINPAETITVLDFQITFTLPEDMSFGFTAGNMKLKTGQTIEIINNLCMPGCPDCCMQTNVCQMWIQEKTILESNEKVFKHFAHLLLPPGLDLSTVSVNELETIIRSIAKLEKSAANLTCNVAKALEKLNDLKINCC